MFAQIEGRRDRRRRQLVDLKRHSRISPTDSLARPKPGSGKLLPFNRAVGEMDVEWPALSRLRLSKLQGTGWMEILGSGMVHPSVVNEADSMATSTTGWAFGMGPARIAMLALTTSPTSGFSTIRT